MSTTSVLLRFPKPVRRSSARDAAHQCGSRGETRCLLAVPFYFCFQVVQDSLLYKACASASPSVERMLCQIDRCEDKLLEFSDVTKCSHHEDVVSARRVPALCLGTEGLREPIVGPEVPDVVGVCKALFEPLLKLLEEHPVTFPVVGFVLLENYRNMFWGLEALVWVKSRTHWTGRTSVEPGLGDLEFDLCRMVSSVPALGTFYF